MQRRDGELNCRDPESKWLMGGEGTVKVNEESVSRKCRISETTHGEGGCVGGGGFILCHSEALKIIPVRCLHISQEFLMQR